MERDKIMIMEENTQDKQYTQSYSRYNGYREPYRNEQGNVMGTAGFILAVLAVLCFWIPFLGQILWLLGLVFSCVGMFRKHKSFAVAGLVLSLAGLIVFVIGVAFFAVTTVFS